MIAALGMYDRPELASANDALWSAVRAELGFGPNTLDRATPMWDIWQSPELLLSQTCGLPFRAHLHDRVQLIGTPDYAVTGCKPGYYRSVIIARKSSGLSLDALSDVTFAYNETGSQSGWAAFWDHVGDKTDVKRMIQSHGHAISAQMVADGDADIAALDWVTWQLVKRYDAFADRLTELALTRPTPGLPFITASTRDAEELFNAVKSAIHGLPKRDKAALMLNGFVAIPKSAYLSEPLPTKATD